MCGYSGRHQQRRPPPLPPTAGDVLSALADPMRRQLLLLLAGQDEATATTLAARVTVTRQAVVKHLAVLEHAGLVAADRVGREVRYVVRPEAVEGAAQWLLAVASHFAELAPQLRIGYQGTGPLLRHDRQLDDPGLGCAGWRSVTGTGHVPEQGHPYGLPQPRHREAPVRQQVGCSCGRKSCRRRMKLRPRMARPLGSGGLETTVRCARWYRHAWCGLRTSGSAPARRRVRCSGRRLRARVALPTGTYARSFSSRSMSRRDRRRRKRADAPGCSPNLRRTETGTSARFTNRNATS